MDSEDSEVEQWTPRSKETFNDLYKKPNQKKFNCHRPGACPCCCSDKWEWGPILTDVLGEGASGKVVVDPLNKDIVWKYQDKDMVPPGEDNVLDTLDDMDREFKDEVIPGTLIFHISKPIWRVQCEHTKTTHRNVRGELVKYNYVQAFNRATNSNEKDDSMVINKLLEKLTDVQFKKLPLEMQEGPNALYNPTHMDIMVIVLQELHNKGLCHADIKEANILISRDGWVILCDWGLTRERSDETNVQVQGTDDYLHPAALWEIKLLHKTIVYTPKVYQSWREKAWSSIDWIYAGLPLVFQKSICTQKLKRKRSEDDEIKKNAEKMYPFCKRSRKTDVKDVGILMCEICDWSAWLIIEAISLGYHPQYPGTPGQFLFTREEILGQRVGHGRPYHKIKNPKIQDCWENILNNWTNSHRNQESLIYMIFFILKIYYKFSDYCHAINAIQTVTTKRGLMYKTKTGKHHLSYTPTGKSDQDHMIWKDVMKSLYDTLIVSIEQYSSEILYTLQVLPSEWEPLVQHKQRIIDNDRETIKTIRKKVEKLGAFKRKSPSEQSIHPSNYSSITEQREKRQRTGHKKFDKKKHSKKKHSKKKHSKKDKKKIKNKHNKKEPVKKIPHKRLKRKYTKKNKLMYLKL